MTYNICQSTGGKDIVDCSARYFCSVHDNNIAMPTQYHMRSSSSSNNLQKYSSRRVVVGVHGAPKEKRDVVNSKQRTLNGRTFRECVPAAKHSHGQMRVRSDVPE